MERTYLVVIGGLPPHPDVLSRLPETAAVVAADGGLDHARRLGLTVDVVVGDLDSVSPAGLAAAEQAGIPVERHPADKDAVDTELAIDVALARGAERIVLLAGAGDRLDHVQATLGLLVAPRLRGTPVEAYVGPAHVQAVQGPGAVEVDGTAGALVSLVPVHGAAVGVTTHGLRFPLAGETLEPWSSRGISNELMAGPARVELEAGALLVIRPDALGAVA